MTQPSMLELIEELETRLAEAKETVCSLDSEMLNYLERKAEKSTDCCGDIVLNLGSWKVGGDGLRGSIFADMERGE